MKNIREANLRTLIIKAIGFLATPIVIAISFKLISGGDHFVWSETHNFIETSAALTCILSAYCLYLYFLNRKTVRHLLLASAFLLAGLFLIAHRFMPEGTDEFSLFYILSGLSAGITLAAGISGEATLEKKPAELKKIAYRSVLLTIAFLSILYFFSAHFDHLLPKVVWGDRFTEAARAMNFLFAGLFFASAALFLQRYKKTKEQEDFLFFFVLIMFFTDRIIASYARMWGSAWWIAHFLRLSITLVLAAYLLRQYARSMLNFVSEIEERKMAQRELTANGQQLKSANQQLTAAEQQLRAQNQQLRAGEEQVRNTTRQIEFILGATQTGLDIIDSDFNLRYVDRGWKKIYGDFTGRKCYEYFMGGSQICCGCGIVKALKAKKIVVSEETLVKENNRPVQVTTIPFQNEKGEWLVAEVNVDITERKTAEEATRESADRLRSVLETIEEGITLSDENGYFYIYNSAMERLTGYSMKEANECSGFIELLFPHPEDQRRAFNELNELFEKGKSREAEKTISTKSGQSKYIRVWSTLTSHKGRRMFLSVYQDITERRKAEEDLRQSELKHRILLENIPQKVFHKNRDSVYVSCNESYAKDLKIRADDIAGKTDYDFYAMELADKYRADDKGIMESGQSRDIEEKYITGGKEYIVHTVKTPVRDSEGNIIGLFGIFWDITMRKEMEKQERLAQLGRLVADMAHEVNNPLMIISGNAQLCLMQDIKDEETKNNLKIIFEECRRAKNIIQRLLKFSRPSRGELKKTDVNRIIESVVCIVEHQFNLAGVTVKRNYLKDPPFISLDEQQIQEVFMNLLTNAKESIAKGGILEITTSLEGDFLRIDFKDTGCGMSEEILKRVFEPFFTTKEKGTGLGLSVCYGIIKAHNGGLKFKSELHKGTVATILLPCREDR